MFYTRGSAELTRHQRSARLNIEPHENIWRNTGIDEIIILRPPCQPGECSKAGNFELAVRFLDKELRHAITTEAICWFSIRAHACRRRRVETFQYPADYPWTERGSDKKGYGLLHRDNGWKAQKLAGLLRELARICDGVKYNDKLRVCFDTCHTSDSGYVI